jgi:hypothetical protein
MAAYTGISNCPPPEFSHWKTFDGVKNDGFTRFWYDVQDANYYQKYSTALNFINSILDKQNYGLTGGNIIPDPGFDNAAVWTIVGAMNIAGSQLNFTGTAPGDSCRPNGVALLANRWYKVEFDFNRVGGTLNILTTGAGTTSDGFSVGGHHVCHVFTGAGGNISIEGAGLLGTLDNFYVTLTVGNHLHQSSIANMPQLLAGAFNFDGASDRIVSEPFTWNSPLTIYAAMRFISWTNNDYLFSGNAAECGILQSGIVPDLVANAGVNSPADANLAINTFGIITLGVDITANDYFQINNFAAFRGSVGNNNPGGFKLGCDFAETVFGHIDVLEIIGRSVFDPGINQRIIYNYLNVHNALGLTPK